MTTRNISLTTGLDSFIEDCVRSGDFQNASEVVREGLRRLKSERDDHAARLARLRAEIQIGVDDYEAGNYVEVDDVDTFLDGLSKELDERGPRG